MFWPPANANACRWSPLHELVPEVPLRHGHAISIDMAYSATLANMRGILSDDEHKRLLNLFSRAGLSMDHHQFDEDILDKATKAILRTRDGKLRAAVPSPLGSCIFLNDVEMSEMYEALRKHKTIMKDYPRQGEGIEAFVDSSDTGYTMNGKPVENEVASAAKNGLHKLNVVSTVMKPVTNGKSGVNGQKSSASVHQNGTSNGINGHANGHVNGNGVVNGAH
jgi:3-dehydroquinate synthase